MIRQRESKLAGLMLLLTLLFGALFVTPISRAETYEWLYLSLHQNVALPNTNVQLSVYGYLEEPARLSVFYIPVEDLDTASRLAERIPALDAVAPLESRTIALNGGKADYVSRTYSFRLGSPGYYVFVAQLADGTFEQREVVLSDRVEPRRQARAQHRPRLRTRPQKRRSVGRHRDSCRIIRSGSCTRDNR